MSYFQQTYAPLNPYQPYRPIVDDSDIRNLMLQQQQSAQQAPSSIDAVKGILTKLGGKEALAEMGVEMPSISSLVSSITGLGGSTAVPGAVATSATTGAAVPANAGFTAAVNGMGTGASSTSGLASLGPTMSIAAPIAGFGAAVALADAVTGTPKRRVEDRDLESNEDLQQLFGGRKAEGRKRANLGKELMSGDHAFIINPLTRKNRDVGQAALHGHSDHNLRSDIIPSGAVVPGHNSADFARNKKILDRLNAAETIDDKVTVARQLREESAPGFNSRFVNKIEEFQKFIDGF